MRFAIAVSLLACGLAQAGEILTNPGFETGNMTPWVSDTQYGNGTPWAVTTDRCHTGSYCAIDTGNIGLVQTFSPVLVSGITDISFWAMHPDPAIVALAIDFKYLDGTTDEFVVDTTGSTWNFFDVFVDLRHTGSLNGFEIYGNSGGVTLADDLSISNGPVGTPEPASFGLLLGGLGAVVLAARRRMA